MKKKILSLLLAAIMVLSMMVVVPITASAEGDTFDTSDYANTETFTISTAEDLVAFASYVRTGKTFANKTVEVIKDIALSEQQAAAWEGIGNGDNSYFDQHFEGTFEGNGHTINLGNVTVNGNHKGGLFRGLSGATVRNFKLLGSINVTGAYNSIGAVACRVRGTTTLKNIQCSVNITKSAASQNAQTIGGFVGLVHNNQATNLTIDGCIFDGEINCSTQADRVGGIIGSTGFTSAARTITIKNTVFAGTIRLGDANTDCSYNIGGFIGHVVSNSGEVVNVYLNDVVSMGKITFANDKAWSTQARGVLFGSLAGTSGDTYTDPMSAYFTNVFYVPMDNYDGTEMPLYGASNLNVGGGTMTRLKNNTYKKTLDEIAALTSSNFTNEATFSFKENTILDTYYPCPSYFAQNGAWATSLKVSVDAMVQGAQIRYNNDAALYSGIRFVAKFRASEVDLEKIGSADANFGLILVSKTKYDALDADATFADIVAAGVQVPALLAENADGIVTVKAVVYNIDEEDYDKDIVAIPYIDGAVAGDALARSIYYVANECVNDESVAVDAPAKVYSQGIVDYVNAQNSDD